MFVVRSEILDSRRFEQRQESAPVASLSLRPLDDPDVLVRFDSFASPGVARATDGELYQLLFGVMGSASSPPTYAVCVEWEVGGQASTNAFEDSRYQLFELRRQHVPGMIFDWLLRRQGQEGQYLALGLCADEAGISLYLSHPEIQRFAQNHPPHRYAASDVGGVRVFRVEDPGPGA